MADSTFRRYPQAHESSRGGGHGGSADSADVHNQDDAELSDWLCVDVHSHPCMVVPVCPQSTRRMARKHRHSPARTAGRQRPGSTFYRAVGCVGHLVASPALPYRCAPKSVARILLARHSERMSGTRHSGSQRTHEHSPRRFAALYGSGPPGSIRACRSNAVAALPPPPQLAQPVARLGAVAQHCGDTAAVQPLDWRLQQPTAVRSRDSRHN